MHEKIAVPIERYPVDLDADVTYAQVPGWLGRTTRDLKLSVMRPLGVEGPLPCLVWFCGGGWMDCDRNVHLPNLVDIVRAGYVVASAEYRDSNKGDFPMPLEDAKAAVRYLRANAASWDIDASKIGVAGESAGGHQACLLGVTGDVERFDVGAHLDQTSRVQAVVDYYGVVSPSRPSATMRATRSTSYTATCWEPSPRTPPSWWQPQTPRPTLPTPSPARRAAPFLILQGAEDVVVPPADSAQLYRVLVENGVDADFVEVEGAGHMDPAFWQPPIVDRVVAFLDRTLKS